MSAPAQDEEWGSATHYNGSQQVEPRLFTEADPMSAVLIPDWDEPGWLLHDEPAWSDPTYVGRRRHRFRGPAHRATDPEPPPEVTEDGAGDERSGDAVTTVRPGTDDAVGSTVDAVIDSATAAPAGGAAADPEQSNRGLLAASGSMAVASLASRVTGFARSILLLAALGLGSVGNAYNSGNNLPNMIYELLLGGVLSSVLIPLLVHAQSEDDDDGIAYTQRLLSIATAALAVMTLAAVLAAPLIAAAFVRAGPERQLTSIFATLLLPEIFFYGLGAMVIAVLNIRHVYRPGAWAPVLNNVIMIATVGVFWLLPGPRTLNPSTITTPQILVIGIGTTLGIAAQALVLIPSMRRSGFAWKWRFRAHPHELGRMREVGSLAGWVLAYVVVSQIGVSVIQKVGIENGGFSVFTNADLLFQMPYGILVVSLLTAIMPRLSRAAVRGDTEAVAADLSLGARLSAVALIPVTAGLIVLGPAMTVTLFAHGETTIGGAHLIGTSLAWSAFGLFPFAIVMLQLRVFYAMRDGRTPTLINGFMVGAKVALVLVTNDIYAHPSSAAVEWLNIATSVSYVIGAIVGHVVLTRRLGRLGFRRVGITVTRIGTASVIGAAVAGAVVFAAERVFGSAHLGSLVGLVAGGLAGLAVLALVAARLRIPELRQLSGALRRG